MIRQVAKSLSGERVRRTLSFLLAYDGMLTVDFSG
jgi:hypothetical protein